jgi:hypothetical protein
MMNHPGDGARGLGRHRVLFNLHAYQLRTNMTALLAHHADQPEELSDGSADRDHPTNVASPPDTATRTGDGGFAAPVNR